MSDEKSQCLKELNRIKAIFKVLHIKPESFSKEIKSDLRKCAEIMVETGATEATSNCILSACTQKMLQQTIEIDLGVQLQLINSNMKEVLSCSKAHSKQLKNDVEHHENIGQIISSGDTILNESSSDYDSTMISNHSVDDNQTPHRKLLLLKKELDIQQKKLKTLQEDVAKFHGLPPNILAARKMLADAKEEEEMLKKDVEQYSLMNSSSVSSFSP